MKSSLTPEQILMVQAHTKSITKRGLGPKLSTTMYDTFFELNPQYQALFSTDFLVKEGDEKITLMAKTQANVVFGFMHVLDNVAKLNLDLERVAMKHVSRHITPDQYDGYGKALILAFKAELGDEMTEELTDAWKAAFGYMAGTLIEMEAALYKKEEQQEGSWKGFRKFKAIRVESTKGHADICKDFTDSEGEDDGTIRKIITFAPVDGGKIPLYDQHNYVCIRMEMEGKITHRNYALDPDVEPADAVAKGTLSVPFSTSDGSRVTRFILDTFSAEEGTEAELSAPIGGFLLMEALSAGI